jgi:protocatechuate 3,4-dioxygenase beta subunit
MAQAYGSDIKLGGQPVKPYMQAEFDAEDRKHITVKVNGKDRYFTAVGNSIEFLSIENAVKVLDLAEGAGTAAVDLFVDRGKTLTVNVQDPDGQSLAGAVVSGMTVSWPITYRLDSATCTVYALDPPKSRQLVFLHPQRMLAAALNVRGDEKEPPVVKLAPVGAVAGRVLDAEGQPVAGATVEPQYVNEALSELYRFLAQQRATVTTDKDGRFRLDGLVPDLKFGLKVRKGQTLLVGQPRIGQKQVGAGATLDLGDFRTKPQTR